jgi:hypothetical protein
VSLLRFRAPLTQPANCDKYGVRTRLGWLIGGFSYDQQITPDCSAKDLAGLRIRLPANHYGRDLCNLGAEVVPMNWADVPKALQSGYRWPKKTLQLPTHASGTTQQKFVTENGPLYGVR